MSALRDPFRKSYSPASEMQQALVTDIRDAASELYELINRVDREYDARRAHLARVRLEEAVSWAIRGALNTGEGVL